MTESVEVTAGASLVTTTSPEVSATVLQKQVLDIPLANRDVTNLIKLQAGVQAFTNRTNTSHQRRPPDVDAGDARRHQHPGQLHPHQLARLPAEPADVRQRRGVLDHDVGVRSRHGGRRNDGADDHAVGHEPVHAAACSSSTATRSSRRTRSSTTPSTPSVPKPESEPSSVRRPRRRADPARQAVLLRLLRGLPADERSRRRTSRFRPTPTFSTACSATSAPTASSDP